MGRVDEALRRAGSDRVISVPETEATETDAPWRFSETDLEAQQQEQADPFRDSPRREVGPDLRTPERRLALFAGFEANAAPKVVGSTGSKVLTEQFRRLAATLHHAQVAQHLRTVMITSASPADGKTLTATNLALTLSESYRRRVLLIDADLRRPSLHRIFQVPNVTGLNEGLNAGADSKLGLLEITPTLTLLPAGTPQPDPMGGLASTRMKRIVAEAQERFDWVIIDTPPVASLADAKLVAGMVDTALLVIRAGVTPFEAVNAAVAAVGREKLMGVVLNGAEDQPDGLDYSRYAPHDEAGAEPARKAD